MALPGKFEPSSWGRAPFIVARLQKQAFRLLPWGVPAFALVAWMVQPALSPEMQWKVWTLGLYGGPSQQVEGTEED